mgnify:CR=1 FL=1
MLFLSKESNKESEAGVKLLTPKLQPEDIYNTSRDCVVSRLMSASCCMSLLPLQNRRPLLQEACRSGSEANVAEMLSMHSPVDAVFEEVCVRVVVVLHIPML